MFTMYLALSNILNELGGLVGEGRLEMAEKNAKETGSSDIQ